MAKVTKSYNFKIYANKGKFKKLDALVLFWKIEVQKKIDIFWDFNNIKGSYCPTEYALGGRLIRDASTKAWQIVKGAKKQKQDKPMFKGNEIDLNTNGVRFLDFKTKEFDFWVKVTHLEKRNRLALPCKKTGIFNKALEIGELKKSAKIFKQKNNYYLQVFIDTPEISKENNNKIGIDIGLTNAVALSNNQIFGQDIKPLRIRTKWRKYKRKISPSKQSLNRVAKEITALNSDTDFVVEDLLFKGKRKRSRTFRRRNNNWAYNHLSKTLESHGRLEGFKVFRVSPEYTSQTCPNCKSINLANREGEKFQCIKCGYQNHADIVGALNILERVAWEHSVPINNIKEESVRYNRLLR